MKHISAARKTYELAYQSFRELDWNKSRRDTTKLARRYTERYIEEKIHTAYLCSPNAAKNALKSFFIRPSNSHKKGENNG